MLEKYEWKRITVSQICLPDEKLALCVPAWEYLFNKFRLGDEDKEILSPEAAILLTKTHPIFVWGSQNICVYGIRTLLISASLIPNATIAVGALPANTPESEIEKLIQADGWLAKLAFATSTPVADLFRSWRNIPKSVLKELSPALDIKVAKLAKVLNVSVPTLYHPREAKK